MAAAAEGAAERRPPCNGWKEGGYEVAVSRVRAARADRTPGVPERAWDPGRPPGRVGPGQ